MKKKEQKSHQENNPKETSIFSKEKVNNDNQTEIDYLKTLGIFLMVTSHVYDEFYPGYFSEIIYFLSFILGAGGFMFLMGILMQYSRHHFPKYYFFRGIGLLTAGQLLNLLRDCLPNLLAFWFTNKNVFIARAMQVLEADILPFAGLSFILLALMKSLKLSNNCILIVSIIMNLFGYILFYLIQSPKNFLLSQFLGFFILTDAEAFFPLFSYFFFVASGYWIGEKYQKIRDKNKLSNYILIFCLPLVSIYYYFRSHYNFPYFPEYFSDEHYSLCPGPDALASVLSNIIGLAFFYKLDIVILKGKTPEFITHAGKHLNNFYILSSSIIFQINIFMIVSRGEHSIKEIRSPTLLALMVLVICRLMIDINEKYIHFSITKMEKKKRNLVFSLIWILTIISVIYIYPKIEVYATFWNNYLKPE